MNSDTVSLREATALTRLWQMAGETVVLTNGCFDILHLGHVRFLTAAKRKGDHLVVCINTDAAVRSLKGPSRPINSENARASVISGLRAVNLVVLMDETDMCHYLERIRPNTWVKGGDYSIGTLNRKEVEVAQKAGVTIDLLDLVEGVSTTNVIEKIQSNRSLQASCA